MFVGGESEVRSEASVWGEFVSTKMVQVGRINDVSRGTAI